MNTGDAVSLTSDVIVGLAALIAGSIAVYGISTWRRQHKAQEDHDVARRLLIGLIMHRDAVADVRTGIMFSGEAQGVKPAIEKPATEEEHRFNETSGSYQNRWKAVLEARVNIYPALVESEALWGDEVRQRVRMILRLERELRLAIQN